MTSNSTLAKADIALQVLLKHGKSNPEIPFQDLMDEIISRWDSDI
jgi:hypothetical protein